MGIARRLGLDFNWYSCFQWDSMLKPGFEPHLVRQHTDGRREMMNADGVVVVEKDGAGSIPAEVEHLLRTAHPGRTLLSPDAMVA